MPRFIVISEEDGGREAYVGGLVEEEGKEWELVGRGMSVGSKGGEKGWLR